MQEIKKEITKEQYEDYLGMTYKARNEEIKDKIPIGWLLGYGYYGHRLMQYGDKYYIVHTIGSTCD